MSKVGDKFIVNTRCWEAIEICLTSGISFHYEITKCFGISAFPIPKLRKTLIIVIIK